MLKLAIISSQYPSNTNHYAHTFIHQRSIYFQNKGCQVVVFVPNKEKSQYIFDDITVKMMPANEISYELKKFDCIYLHLLHIKKPQKSISGDLIYKEIIDKNIPVALYIHGAEVQKVSSRPFEIEYTLKGILTYIYKDFYYIPKVSKFYKKLINSSNYSIATPSIWMKKEAEMNLKLKMDNIKIIPNGIDTKKFFPMSNYSKYNKRLLSIRQLTSSKYAVDITIKMMKYLPDYILDLYGKGKKLDEYKKLAKDLGVINRINFIENLIPNSEMPNVMNKYKFFICPTRMDAQGVSMCEAMACGCVVVTNNNTAIPEFVINDQNGICVEDPFEMANKILELDQDDDRYNCMSISARASALLLDLDITLMEELEMLKMLSLANK